jgi:hypothetical protein
VDAGGQLGAVTGVARRAPLMASPAKPDSSISSPSGTPWVGRL